MFFIQRSKVVECTYCLQEIAYKKINAQIAKKRKRSGNKVQVFLSILNVTIQGYKRLYFLITIRLYYTTVTIPHKTDNDYPVVFRLVFIKL